MARFFIGLLLGGALGAGGTYYTLTEAAVETAEVADAGPTTVAEAKPKKRKKRRRKRSKRGKNARPDEVVGDEALMEPEAAPQLTAEDRVVVWRGAKVAIGSRDVDLDGPEARGLNESEIERTVSGATDRFVRCILDAQGQARLQSTVRVKFRVDGAGKVGAVRTQAARYLHDQGVGACVKGVAKGLRFPSTGAPTVVELPFNAR